MASPIDRRVAFTRVGNYVKHNVPSASGDVANLLDFAEHLRHALACIIDKECTPTEARRIAKRARMGEEWE